MKLCLFTIINEFKMGRMIKINLFQTILLILSSGIDGTAINNVNADSETPSNSPIIPPPPIINKDSVQEQQNISSTCHAVRAVLDHEGKIAQWKSNCRVEVWNDKERPELRDLNEDQRESVLRSLSQPPYLSQPQTVPLPGTEPFVSPFTDPTNYNNSNSNSNTFEKSKYLKDEASLQHYMCMEAKRSLLSQLKAQMKCSAASSIKTLKLTPELEAFIGQVNDSMKESLARIHSLEQSGNQQLEALKTENANLTALIDEYCKDDHPSIRYHDVGYLPHADLGKVKMTLIINKPGQRAEFFNLPENAFARHIEYLRGMTDAAAQHAQITGQRGDFEVVHNPYPNPLKLEQLKSFTAVQPNFEVPSVISVTPSKPQEPESRPIYSNIDEPVAVAVAVPVTEESQSLDEKPNGVLETNQISNPDTLNTSQLSENNDSAPSAPSAPPLPEISVKNSISDYWESIYKSEGDYKNIVEKLRANPKDKALLLQEEAKKKYAAEIEQTILKLVDPVNFETSSPLPLDDSVTKKLWGKSYKDLNTDEKEIEEKYLRSKELLKKARDYVQLKKSVFSKTTLADKIYDTGKILIKSIREKERKALIDKNPPQKQVGNRFFSLFGPKS